VTGGTTPTSETASGAEAVGLKGFGFHEVRHSFASFMIASGCHPGVLKELIGHESIRTTIDTYGHLYPDAKQAARAALDAHMDECAENPGPISAL
jgi:integrase